MSHEPRTKVLTLTKTEQKMVVKGLYDIRKKLRDTGDPANDVEDLILRVIHAPERREARRADRDAAR